jgi:hypothetical protein
MAGEFYQVNGPWFGNLWIAARPRGGDWLEDEIARWSSQGASAVLSLLTSDEERDIDLENEASVARNEGMEFVSLPVADRDIPSSESKPSNGWIPRLQPGRPWSCICRQGIGRSGMAAACALVLSGVEPATGIARASSTQGFAVPETDLQRE